MAKTGISKKREFLSKKVKNGDFRHVEKQLKKGSFLTKPCLAKANPKSTVKNPRKLTADPRQIWPNPAPARNPRAQIPHFREIPEIPARTRAEMRTFPRAQKCARARAQNSPKFPKIPNSRNFPGPKKADRNFGKNTVFQKGAKKKNYTRAMRTFGQKRRQRREEEKKLYEGYAHKMSPPDFSRAKMHNRT